MALKTDQNSYRIRSSTARRWDVYRLQSMVHLLEYVDSFEGYFTEVIERYKSMYLHDETHGTKIIFMGMYHDPRLSDIGNTRVHMEQMTVEVVNTRTLR